MILIVEIRCDTEVVGLRVLGSSPGGFTACHRSSIVLGTLREVVPVTFAVVSTAMRVAPCY